MDQGWREIPPRVHVGLLSFRRRVCAQLCTWFLRAGQTGQLTIVGFTECYASSTDYGHNKMVRSAIRNLDADYLLILGDDTHFGDGQADESLHHLREMIVWMRDHDFHVAAPPIPVASDGKPNVLLPHHRKGEHRAEWWQVKTAQDARGVGSAAMAIDLHWLRIHWPIHISQPPWFQARQNQVGITRGTDFGFCFDVIDRGGKVGSYGPLWGWNGEVAPPSRHIKPPDKKSRGKR